LVSQNAVLAVFAAGVVVDVVTAVHIPASIAVFGAGQSTTSPFHLQNKLYSH